MPRMDKRLKCDGGYGVAGNIITEWYINQLTIENQEKYRRKLKEQDTMKYEEYVEWEKSIRS